MKRVNRANGQSQIEVVSDVNDCDLRCLPRPVSKGNSRFVSIVILLSLSSCARSLREVSSRTFASPELQADLQGAADLQAGQEWPFLFVASVPEIVGKHRKSGSRRRNARKKRTRLFRYIAERTMRGCIGARDVVYSRAIYVDSNRKKSDCR